jgi:serine/threonine-protein phosphatase 2A regulatory subunit B'
VAERALFLWNNDHIENLIKQNYKVLLPIIYPALERNSRDHWNVRKIFSDHDSAFFGECVQRFNDEELKQEKSDSKREALWKRLEEMAASKPGENNPLGAPNGKPSQAAG